MMQSLPALPFIAICTISLSACSTARISPQGITSSRIGTEYVSVNNPFGADAQNDIEPENSKSDTTRRVEVPDSIALQFSAESGTYLGQPSPTSVIFDPNPPEDSEKQYNVRDDSAFGKVLFFYDGETIRRISYTTEIVFKPDIVDELPPKYFISPWDSQINGALIYDCSMLEQNRSILIDDTQRSVPR